MKSRKLSREGDSPSNQIQWSFIFHCKAKTLLSLHSHALFSPKLIAAPTKVKFGIPQLTLVKLDLKAQNYQVLSPLEVFFPVFFCYPQRKPLIPAVPILYNSIKTEMSSPSVYVII